MNRLLSTLAIASAVVVVSSDRAEAACEKWVATGVAPCQVLNVSCGLGPPDLPFFQQKAFYDIIHQDSAKAACIAGAKNTVWETGHTIDVYINMAEDPGFGYCLAKEGSGTPVFPTDHVGGWTVVYMAIPREACCERVPHGPYSNGVPGTSGGEFSSTKKTTVKDANIAMNGSLKSDYGKFFADGKTRWFDSEPLYLSYDQFWYFNVDDDGNMVTKGFLKVWNPTYSNIDHIVPRKDKFGCDCGTNSLDNALVISAGLNVKMSNNCEDENRVKILNKWAP